MPFGVAAAAAVGSAAIGAGASIYGANKQAGAIKDAQAQQARLAEQQRSDLAPWRDTGTTANTAAANLLGINGPEAATTAFNAFQTSPSYQWQIDQGLRAVDAGAAAKGMLRSGATLQAEQLLGQNLAQQDFANYYNRLFALSGQGVQAAGGGASTTNAGIQAAGQSADAMGSIYGDTAQGIGNYANKLLSNKDFQAWMGGTVGPSQAAANGLYQQNMFSQYPAGTYGPFQ